MQQDQEKITETNKNQIKVKQKKTKSNDESSVAKQEMTFPACKGTWKKSQIDWIFVEYA